MSELSIVIRTANCRDTLGECLAGLARQTFRDFELIVVDSGSRDGTAEAARAAGARVLSVPAGSFTYGGTLNLGCREARGRFLASLSAHSLLMEPTVLDRLLAALRTRKRWPRRPAGRPSGSRGTPSGSSATWACPTPSRSSGASCGRRLPFPRSGARTRNGRPSTWTGGMPRSASSPPASGTASTGTGATTCASTATTC